MKKRVNFRVVRALVKRDLRKYITNPMGYVFVTLFIFLSAAAAFWQNAFFLNNLANLDQLNRVFPYLLLFFIPALTMGVWSEEKKQGTDELLLTLPANDLEVILGKYLATVGVYSAALLLSLSHVLVLIWLGSPDLGLMFANYLGYWLIGDCLIAVGMLASLLTANATIAFILGSSLCALLVLIDSLGAVFSDTFQHLLAPLGVFGHFGDFAQGVISFSGILYFLSVTGLLVYLNVILIGRRHWPRRADGYPMWQHQCVRGIALVIGLISLNTILGRASLRLDVTAEQLHSLSDETRRLIGELSVDRPVFIQAFVSPQVPQQFVQTRANLLGILREIDAIAGPKVEVAIRETESFTEDARDAREEFGIVARQVPNLGSSARAGFEDVFMGVAFTCGAEEQVIPFFDRGLPVEYEITRSMRVVARTKRKKIGVINTQIRLFGGMDFQTMRSTPAWSVVEELKKQYEVVQISPLNPITEDIDGLLAVLPSSLSQPEMDNLMTAIEDGTPALLLVDPLPVVNIGMAPAEKSGANVNPFMRQQGPPPKEKGDIQAFLARLGVRWDSTRITWDSYNPHPDLAQLPPEVVFIGEGNQNKEAFNQKDQASSQLQELVLIYPGEIGKAAGSQYEFRPLLKSDRASGTLSYYQMVQRSFFGTQLNRNLPHRPDGNNYTLAAHIQGQAATARDDAQKEKTDKADTDTEKPKAESNSKPLNVIVIADLDFISEQFFEIRKAGPANLNFDNVTFFLNSMDVLLGDESFLDLRKRRVKHRTLDRVETRTRNFEEHRLTEEEAAEKEADAALKDAQQRLDEKVNEVRQRPDLDSQTKQIMARNLQEVENRRFEVLKNTIEEKKKARIQRSEEDKESQIRRIESNIRTFAVLLPPIPIIALGVMIFIRRQKREKAGAAAARRLRA